MPWIQGATFGQDVSDVQCLIQSNYGRKGNFELLINTGTKNLQHWFRNNDDPHMPWIQGATFGVGVNEPSSLIQNGYDTKGNFEVIAD